MPLSFSLVDDFSNLTGPELGSLRDALAAFPSLAPHWLKQLEEKKYRALGIRCQDKIVGLLIFHDRQRQGEPICELDLVWRNEQYGAEFRKVTGVSIPRFLHEELVRRGKRNFFVTSFTPAGRQLAIRLVRNQFMRTKKVAAGLPSRKISVTEKGIRLAHSRANRL